MPDNDANNNLMIYRASAGAGKTYNLALQYVVHLLFDTSQGQWTPRRALPDTGNRPPVNAHRLLLAITFTVKSTNEMKQRILDELQDLATNNGNESNYINYLTSQSQLDATCISTMARLALGELLTDYTNFHVSTIDSFFQSILREFARELDRDYNYDIQLNVNYAAKVAVNNFLLSLGNTSRRMGKDSEIEKWVKNFLRQQINQKSSTNEYNKGLLKDVSRSLEALSIKTTDERFAPHMQEIRDYLGVEVEENNQGITCNLDNLTKFKLYLSKIQKTCLENIKNVHELTKHIIDNNQLTKLIKKNSALIKYYEKDSEIQPTDTLRNADGARIAGQFKKEAQDMLTDVIISSLVNNMRQAYDMWDIYNFCHSTEDDLGLLGMLGVIDQYLQRYRQDSGAILISDTTALIATVLASGVPFVYERIGTCIKHYMIDEFQDTSTQQYNNFKALIQDSLDNGNFNMLIGDTKQCIYKFRGADIDVFRTKVNEDFKQHINEQRLTINYRSDYNIIQFNNQLFDFIVKYFPVDSPIRSAYEDVGQSPILEDDTRGFVRVVTSDFNGEAFQVNATRNQQVRPFSDSVLDMLPQYLLQLHERFEWGEIGILVNSNKQGKDVVECLLKHNGKAEASQHINITSGESLLLANSPLVGRLIAMLRFIDVAQPAPQADEDEPDDITTSKQQLLQRMRNKRIAEQRLYSSLSSFIERVDDNNDNAEDNGKLLAEVFNELNTSAHDVQKTFDNQLQQLLPNAQTELTTLINVTENIIAHLNKQGKARADVPFLLAFQDTVLQFCAQRNGGSVREFLHYWDENSDNITIKGSTGSNSINIMTIHKAKGLQFPCVIIPFADWSIDKSKDDAYWLTQDQMSNVIEELQQHWPQMPAPNKDIIIPPMVQVGKKYIVTLIDSNLLDNGEARQFVEKQLTDAKLDNLNKTYVALTRPHNELHIFTRPDNALDGNQPDGNGNYSTTTSLTAANLIYAFAHSRMNAVEDKPGWFELGVPTTQDNVTRKDNNETQGMSGMTDTLDYYVNSIPPTLLVQMDDVDSTYIDAGNRLHNIMGRIHSCNDVERVIANARKRGSISDNPDDLCNDDTIGRIRDAIAHHPIISQWFAPDNHVFNERTITQPGNHGDNSVDNNRPDRVVQRADGTIIIIDYKSGYDLCTDDYTSQVRKYMNLFTAMGYQHVEGYIWYVNLNRIINDVGHTVCQWS